MAMNKKVIGLVAAPVLLLGSMTVQAVPILDLFDGASIVVEDKTFSDWQLIGNVVRNGFNDPIASADASVIEVVALEGDPLNPGLSYFGNGEWFVEFDGDPVTSRVSQSFSFSFTVSTNDGSSSIKDNSLELPETGFAINDDSAEIVISEIVDTLGGSLLGTKEVFVETGFTPVSTLFDRIDFTPQSAIRVTNNIFFQIDAGGNLQLDTFEQRFSQVPEPSIITLLAVGLAGMGFARRRMNRAEYTA
jgi:hypothetical protein